MTQSKHLRWPEALQFMLRDLRATKLIKVRRTVMDAGNVRIRHLLSPKDGWEGEATFSSEEKRLMESLIGKTAFAQLPHRNEVSLVVLMHDQAIYPGYGAKILQETWNSDGHHAYKIQFHLMDHGPFPATAADPSSSEAI